MGENIERIPFIRGNLQMLDQLMNDAMRLSQV